MGILPKILKELKMNTLILSLLITSIPLSFLINAWFIGKCKNANQGSSLFYTAITNIILLTTVTTLYRTTSLAITDVFALSNTRLIMLFLILFIGVSLVKFCQNYMMGEPKINDFWRWLGITLSSVSLVVISNHMILFWISWVAISLAFHKLLMFYPNRPRAALGAHKKFIVARLAESFLFIAFVLLYVANDTWLISDIIHQYSVQSTSLSFYEHLAATLIALAALIKCAQLPLHGWLIQVVEAPTPVSALLHAGIINLGGFLLILFAPLFIQSISAQWLVLVVAGLTTLISALVMTTRVSVKVRLAWSTSAQMGLMLLQCALGLFELALMHLVMHSVYKAYAFLNAGNAVNEDIHRRHVVQQVPLKVHWLAAFSLASITVTSFAFLTSYQGPVSIGLLLVTALTLLIAAKLASNKQPLFLPALVITLLITTAYFALKAIFSLVINTTTFQVVAFSAADIWVIALITTLAALSYLLQYKNHHAKTKALSTLLFAGLYLDEWFTQITLKLWPIRLPVRSQVNKKHQGTVLTSQESHA